MLEQVFVYGTLRRGEVNHHLLGGAVFVGQHMTPPCYRMLHLGAYPGVVEGGRVCIAGEIYRVDRQQLVQLDKLEAYPTLFTRKLIPSPWGRAWIYLFRGRRQGRAVIPGGNWLGQTKQSGPFSLY